MPKLGILVTEDWVFVSHRLNLGARAVSAGYETVVITRCRSHQSIIESRGIRTCPIEVNRGGRGVFGLIGEAIRLFWIYQKEKFDLVCHVALRPAVVGALAAKCSGRIRVVAVLTGLGFLFTGERANSMLSRALGKILPWLLRHSLVVVQNRDDFNVLVKFGIDPGQMRIVRGAGVDIEKFKPMPESPGPPVILLHARMLWDKGVGEFVRAAEILKTRGCQARFVLVGEPDDHNPASVDRETWNRWKQSLAVECLGQQKEIHAILAQASVVCLPSYREGLPKSLLEGLACGKPCVTTDTPGCREVVTDGENGFLVPAKNAERLAEALETLIRNPSLRVIMGGKGRERAVADFDENIIIQQMLGIFGEVMSEGYAGGRI